MPQPSDEPRVPLTIMDACILTIVIHPMLVMAMSLLVDLKARLESISMAKFDEPTSFLCILLPMPATISAVAAMSLTLTMTPARKNHMPSYMKDVL